MSKGPAEVKKEEKSQGAEHHPKKADVPAPKGKAHSVAPGGCHSWSCKKEATRFNFCEEHYEHFKFGLIKKTGEPVPDFEKKFEHFVAHQRKKSAQKVA